MATQCAHIKNADFDVSFRDDVKRHLQTLTEQLHDGLAQVLTGIALKSKHLAEDLKLEHSLHAPRAEELTRLLEQAIGQTRDVARYLSPFAVDVEELIGALAKYAASVSELNRIQCRLKSPHQTLYFDQETGAHVFYIVQQAVQNAIEHGKAKSIDIEIAADGDDLKLVIADDGDGFRATKNHANGGLGLHLMKFRAAALNCFMEIVSRPGAGTKVAISRQRSRQGPKGSQTH
jgi:signal transduction histidine kinase